MSMTPLANAVMKILQENRTLGPCLENKLRNLFSVSLETLTKDETKTPEEKLAELVGDTLASTLAKKLGIEETPSKEDQLRALYPSIAIMQQQRGRPSQVVDTMESDAKLTDSMYPSMKKEV
jgi:hypothetical protein